MPEVPPRHTLEASPRPSLIAAAAAGMSFAMSATEPQPPTYTCSHCGRAHTHAETVEGSYCSRSCYYRERGTNLLAKVESQSQFCDTCYGHVRDVEPIPETVHPQGDGLQFPTPNTTIGVDDFSSDPYQRFEGTRWSCACGAVDPDSGPIAEIQNAHLATVIANLYQALDWLAEREAIPEAPDRRAYFDALRKRERDAAYAVGRAIYA